MYPCIDSIDRPAPVDISESAKARNESGTKQSISETCSGGVCRGKSSAMAAQDGIYEGPMRLEGSEGKGHGFKTEAIGTTQIDS